MSTSTTPNIKSQILKPFQRFLQNEAAGGVLLFLAAAIALIWANSPFAPQYFAIWQTPFVLKVGPIQLEKTVVLMINDGLMALFFFVIGLEIKREVLVGELSNLKNAALPVAAALGGMIVPAAIFALINNGLPSARGWGIPMATDIAFALGVMILLKDRVPFALRIFLTALAIGDDVGAVLVIAIFYTASLDIGYLIAAGGVLAVLILANFMKVGKALPYVLLGLVLWYLVLKSGVHATIAGVLAALCIPARSNIGGQLFLEDGKSLIDEFEQLQDLPAKQPLCPEHEEIVSQMHEVIERVGSPLSLLLHRLHPIISFFIMPVFALANAGVQFSAQSFSFSPVVTGIVAGLVVGKQLGIFGACKLAVKLGWARLPSGVSWAQIYGAAWLAGIGFTMSLFVASLAFELQPELLNQAKVGIIIGSVLSAIGGIVILVRAKPVASESKS